MSADSIDAFDYLKASDHNSNLIRNVDPKEALHRKRG